MISLSKNTQIISLATLIAVVAAAVLMPTSSQAWPVIPFRDPAGNVASKSVGVSEAAAVDGEAHWLDATSNDNRTADVDSLLELSSTRNRTLMFSDDFDGTALDESRWHPHYWWRDDAGGSTIAPNNELQWYQPDDVLVGDGSLLLRAQQRTVTNLEGNVYNFTSGVVTTGRDHGDEAASDKFAFLYGYAEARLRMPDGQGLWPAFWLLSANQEWPPEIDVMEYLGHETNSTHMTVHFVNDTGSYQGAGAEWTGPDFSSDWHTFAIDWRPDSIAWYVDGIERHRTTDASAIPHQSMYLVLNLAVGGDWPGAPDASTQFPSYFQVDYVRVWSPTTGDAEPGTQQTLLTSESSQS